MGSRIIKFIESICVQNAVYWAPPTFDGYGGSIFSAPMAIKCRWSDAPFIVKSKLGAMVIGSASVMVVDEVEEQGILWLGALADLTAEEKADPITNLQDAKIIKMRGKSPLLRSTTEFIHYAILEGK